MYRKFTANAAFTVEGEKSLECMQELTTWIKGCCEENNIKLIHFRYDFREDEVVKKIEFKSGKGEKDV